MTYTPAFDIATAGFKPENYQPLIIGSFFCLLSLWMIIKRDYFAAPARKRPMNPKMPFIFFGMSALFLIGVSYAIFSGSASALAALREGRTSVAEGRVTHFVPMPYTGHALEKFCVQSACFSYSDYVLNPGFNHTSSHGGPIHEGLPVRVTYTGNTILRLEIGQE